MREVASRDYHFSHALGDMTVTLDDVACLTHLQIEGRMVSHGKKMLRHEAATLLVMHLGVSQTEAEKISGTEYGGFISYPKLRELYTRYLDRANKLAGTEEMEELERVRKFFVRFYLLYLVGCLLFGERSNKRIELVYLMTMEDGYAGMRNYSWGGMTLAYLYNELAVIPILNVSRKFSMCIIFSTGYIRVYNIKTSNEYYLQ